MDNWYFYKSCKVKPVTLLKVSLFQGCFFHVFYVVQMIPIRSKRYIWYFSYVAQELATKSDESNFLQNLIKALSLVVEISMCRMTC